MKNSTSDIHKHDSLHQQHVPGAEVKILEAIKSVSLHEPPIKRKETYVN